MKDKTVIVTGAARGLGQKYALELSKAGALVVAADINSCEETKKLIQENGNDCLALELDVTDFNSCKNLIIRNNYSFWATAINDVPNGKLTNFSMPASTFPTWVNIALTGGEAGSISTSYSSSSK